MLCPKLSSLFTKSHLERCAARPARVGWPVGFGLSDSTLTWHKSGQRMDLRLCTVALPRGIAPFAPRSRWLLCIEGSGLCRGTCVGNASWTTAWFIPYRPSRPKPCTYDGLSWPGADNCHETPMFFFTATQHKGKGTWRYPPTDTRIGCSINSFGKPRDQGKIRIQSFDGRSNG